MYVFDIRTAQHRIHLNLIWILKTRKPNHRTTFLLIPIYRNLLSMVLFGFCVELVGVPRRLGTDNWKNNNDMCRSIATPCLSQYILGSTCKCRLGSFRRWSPKTNLSSFGSGSQQPTTLRVSHLLTPREVKGRDGIGLNPMFEFALMVRVWYLDMFGHI